MYTSLSFACGLSWWVSSLWLSGAFCLTLVDIWHSGAVVSCVLSVFCLILENVCVLPLLWALARDVVSRLDGFNPFTFNWESCQCVEVAYALLVDGKLYTLLISSSLFLVAVTVQSLPPFLLHPWSTGGLLVVIVSVPFLCTVTPSFSGWNIVLYPLFDSLWALIDDCCRCGSMCASLVFLLSCQNGRDVLFDVWSVSPLGRWTVYLTSLAQVSPCLHCKNAMLHLSQWPFVSHVF